jgi:protein-L-isoaspartate O-methyltransferase
VDHHVTVPVSYFNRLYEKSTDPWHLATRWYETRKYHLTVASLPRQHYRRAFEPGCSVGILTAMLAERCDALLATDAVMDAVTTTRDRLARQPHVDVAQMRVPAQWPTGPFDLIVISEFGYYLAPPDLLALVRRSADILDADGTLVAVHWRHAIEDFVLTGEAVHNAFKADLRLEHLAHYEEPDFLLDVFTRARTAA